ncbi:MAG: serine/threonine protein phosphatase [Syntrophomonadaceae bacterium]|nr:serine/threonine protein phosphatase [Syntrophomonadaceae bacterium]
MRFIYLTDTHCRGTPPVNRKDDYVTALRAKLNEVALLAREWEVTALLHGGDLWDLPNPSIKVVNYFISSLKAAQVPIYIIAGNHDLRGQDLNTLPHTMLGLQNELGLLRLIHSGERLYFQDQNVRVQITGQPYHLEIDQRDPRLDYCVQKQNCDYAIHMVHGMLMAEERYPGSQHTQFSQIYETEADLTLASHMHFGFPDHNYQGKQILNIGALVRLSNHLVEIQRPVQVLLIDLSGGQIELRKLPLKSVLPGHQVLDRGIAEQMAGQVRKLVAAIQWARETREFKEYGLKELVEIIGNQEGASQKVRMEALRSVYVVSHRQVDLEKSDIEAKFRIG